MVSESVSHSAIGILRAFILITGWPILIIGSGIFVTQGVKFLAQTKGTVFGKLVLPTILGWLITMYLLGVSATLYMVDVPVKGTLVVLPIFVIWFITFIILSVTIRRWSKEAIRIKDFYYSLEEKIAERTKELEVANKQQQEKIGELDRASKLLENKDRELHLVNKELRELDEAKTQFVSVAAHQLRTPLSVSKWTFQMLLSGDFGSLNLEQQAVLHRGNEMNEQMINLVSDLLDVARIESGKVEYQFAFIDLTQFLFDIQNIYLPQAKTKNILLTIPIPQEGTFFVRADEMRLRMVFQNLLDNALKFTPTGGTIRLDFTKNENAIEFQLSDSGIGISKEDMPRLFTKFFRARNAVAMDTHGTGLGLYIVASIIKIHGGTIAVSSETGKGTTVRFTLPLATGNVMKEDTQAIHASIAM